MNDTDALISRGLFPIIPPAGPSDLVLKAESLTVILTQTGVLERRSYLVRNPGPARDVELGTILGVNVATPDTSSEAIRVALDGIDLPVRVRLGLLSNRDGRVTVTSPDAGGVRNCIEHNDGGVCSQDWVGFPVSLRAGQERRVSLEFRTRCGPRTAIELAIARLHFYTEQFWAGPVGSMVAQLDTKGFGLHAKGFVPSGQYLRNSTKPTEVGEYVLVWRFKNYRQARYYGGGLVHPFAVNGEALLDRYLRGVGRSSGDTTSAHILNADTLLVNSATGGLKPVSIAFALHSPATVMLNIWSDDGRVIRRLPQLETDIGTHRVDWDGLDYLRRPVPPGTYRFRLEVNGNWVGDREILVAR